MKDNPSPVIADSTRRPLVLVVDDHDDTRELLRFVFEAKGYLVIEASDGADAVDMAVQQQPDLIVTDTTLKRLDGLEATRRIRRTPSLSGLPIIFLSGHVQPQARVEAMDSGANDYLIKPVSLDQLEKSIANQMLRDGSETKPAL